MVYNTTRSSHDLLRLNLLWDYVPRHCIIIFHALLCLLDLLRLRYRGSYLFSCTTSPRAYASCIVPGPNLPLSWLSSGRVILTSILLLEYDTLRSRREFCLRRRGASPSMESAFRDGCIFIMCPCSLYSAEAWAFLCFQAELEAWKSPVYVNIAQILVRSGPYLCSIRRLIRSRRRTRPPSVQSSAIRSTVDLSHARLLSVSCS